MYGLEDRHERMKEVIAVHRGQAFIPVAMDISFGMLTPQDFCLELTVVIMHQCGRTHCIGTAALV